MWGFVNTLYRGMEYLIDVLLPPRQRTLRMRSRSLSDLSLIPTPHALCGITITTLLDYRTQVAQDAIRALKYDGSHSSANLLAEAVADHLREEISSMHAISPRPILLVPVPLHTSRKRERGFNQIERVLQALPNEFRDGTLSRIQGTALTRIRHTPQQTKLSRAERLKNVRGAFAVNAELTSSAHLIIIDDVVTTGATLAECVHAAKKSGASVTALALARA